MADKETVDPAEQKRLEHLEHKRLLKRESRERTGGDLPVINARERARLRQRKSRAARNVIHTSIRATPCEYELLKAVVAAEHDKKGMIVAPMPSPCLDGDNLMENRHFWVSSETLKILKEFLKKCRALRGAALNQLAKTERSGKCHRKNA